MERTVHISEKGMKLDRFLRIHASTLPAAAALLKQGRLTVDGRRARGSDALVPGQVVRITDPRPRTASPDGEGAGPSPADRDRLAAMTLWSDDDLIVFDKPSGLAVHKGTRTEDDLDSLLARFVDAEGERPLLVHRLDKDTSGLIVAARRRAVAARLGAAFAGRAVEKTYLALVEGVPVPPSGRVGLPLRKMVTPRGGRMVEAATDDPEGLAAETGYEVIEVRDGGRSSLLRLSPKTGRQHQLRAHMALIGHPILGDRLYGRANSASRLMLHAHRLCFPGPHGDTVVLEAPIPAAFAG